VSELDSGSQPPVFWAVSAVALSALLLQAGLARMRRPAALRVSQKLFWISAPAWVGSGFLLNGGGEAPSFHAWIWILPGIGLLLSALMQWSVHDLADRLREEVTRHTTGDESEESPSSPLDADDQLLLHRLVTLLAKPARGVMTPVHEAVSARESQSFAEVAETMAARGVARLPVLDDSCAKVVGLLTDGDILRVRAEDAAGARPTAGELARPIRGVDPGQRVADVLDVLRGEGGGLIAVVLPDGRAAGFIAWDQVFSALIARRGARASVSIAAADATGRDAR
jgi:CBS domain-containing protein